MNRKLVWTDQNVQRFWDHLAMDPDLDKKYFTYQNGKGITNFLQAFFSLKGKKICDFGCGKGFLIENLLAAGAEVWALDYSDASVDHVNKTFQSKGGWNGAVKADGENLVFNDDFFDVIVCVETIEHVLDEHLGKMMLELKRILKPGGYVLFTTPCNEDIEKQMIYCPNCESIFHRMQHVRSWSEATLSNYCSEFNFQSIFVQGMNLRSFNENPVKIGSILDISPRKLYQLVEYYLHKGRGKKSLLNFLLRKFNTRRHLVALITK
jgi:2-polyprenyl-3-methyl-5-hydroxy-6-metoxy-1,4-benzoquinol methylase